ncbi:MAG: MCE family protein [Halioglobus sp.]|nr:MCE family protein [Halioglobus sp.]
MSDKPQNVATGAFVLGALLIAAITLIYLLGSGFKKTEKIVMAFDGAARGLNVGSPIALRGVKIGQVLDVDVVLDTHTADIYVVVTGEIDDSTIRYLGDPGKVSIEDLIHRGLRAQLNIQSLVTGLLYIEIDFHPGSKLTLVDIDSPYQQFPTIPTSLERLAKKFDDIDFETLSNKLQAIGEAVESVLDSKDLQKVPGNVNATLASLRDLSQALQNQLASLAPRLDNVLEEASSTLTSTNTELKKSFDAFQQSLDNLDNITSNDSVTLYELNMALQEVSRASRALRQLAITLENNPEALLKGRSGEQ